MLISRVGICSGFPPLLRIALKFKKNSEGQPEFDEDKRKTSIGFSKWNNYLNYSAFASRKSPNDLIMMFPPVQWITGFVEKSATP